MGPARAPRRRAGAAPSEKKKTVFVKNKAKGDGHTTQHCAMMKAVVLVGVFLLSSFKRHWIFSVSKLACLARIKYSASSLILHLPYFSGLWLFGS
jgi:hypothetical protein